MILYKILVFILYLPVKIFFPCKVLGKENLPKKSAYILVCNHLSWKDIFILSINIRGYRKIVAKKEIGKGPFMRFLVKCLGAILVDRQNVDLTSIRACINALKSGKSLIIFPEGTRNREDVDKLQEIKHGAAMMAIKSKAPIVPSIIKNKQRLFRKNYVYVGAPLSLEEFSTGRLSSEKLDSAAELMGNSMIGIKKELDGYLLGKGKKDK